MRVLGTLQNDIFRSLVVTAPAQRDYHGIGHNVVVVSAVVDVNTYAWFSGRYRSATILSLTCTIQGSVILYCRARSNLGTSTNTGSNDFGEVRLTFTFFSAEV